MRKVGCPPIPILKTIFHEKEARIKEKRRGENHRGEQKIIPPGALYRSIIDKSYRTKRHLTVISK